MKCCWIFKPQPQSNLQNGQNNWLVGWYLWKEMGNWYGHTWCLGFAINVILNINNMSQVTTPQFVTL